MLSEKQLIALRVSAEALVGTDAAIAPEQFVSLINDTIERLHVHREEQRRSAERLAIAVESINKYVSDPKSRAYTLEAIEKVGTGAHSSNL